MRRRVPPAALISLALAWIFCPPSVGLESGETPSKPARYPRPLIIAHRGGAAEFTENTIAAFRRALRAGAEGIETDLRLTRDGEVVIYHDEKFGRVEGLAPAHRTRAIADLTLAEILSQTLVPVGQDTGGQRVPTLKDLLAQVDTGLLNIEIKRGARFDELVDRTIELLRGFSGRDRVVLEPPDLATARKLRAALGPRLKLQINPSSHGTLGFIESLEKVLEFRPHSVSVSYKKLSFEIVDLARKAGVEVWVWTVDSPDIARAMALLGVDAIKTDSPSLLLRLFDREGRRPVAPQR